MILLERWLKLQNRILNYQKELADLGVNDYDVPSHKESDDIDGTLRKIRLPFTILHLLFVFALSSIPSILLNVPVGIAARVYSERKRKKALAIRAEVGMPLLDEKISPQRRTNATHRRRILQYIMLII